MLHAVCTVQAHSPPRRRSIAPCARTARATTGCVGICTYLLRKHLPSSKYSRNCSRIELRRLTYACMITSTNDRGFCTKHKQQAGRTQYFAVDYTKSHLPVVKRGASAPCSRRCKAVFAFSGEKGN